ncbi:phosphoribosylamine--glycine ligase [Lentisphaerota bacterium ZTH]|nr:phosphoribosylamine--glycine ligase [Lentisphaerota bacterium]WET05302.1 phosphoribosylamine--glycine ligase [Lentisphaerota bacterium ZTH]
MKVLVVGSGGREHTLCWKLGQSPMVDKLYCAPGNAGIAGVAECVDIDVLELDKLAKFAVDNAIDFAVVGPEAPLCAGLVDVFKAKGIKVFGPSKEAARLEGSKDFAKQFMLKYNIPTAKAASFTAATPAEEYIREEFAGGAEGIVIKADGLAAGKGVCVAENEETAIEFMRSCLDGVFGDSGSQVLIEECLFGEEASILALTDGKTIVPLVSSQDHKRAFDNDEGPNTGGMGAYSPAPVVDAVTMEVVNSQILDNFLKGIQAEGLDFKGLLFVGIMVNEHGPKVLEFNVRFGDPEVQAVMCRLESDLLDVMLKTAEGRLDEAELVWSDDPAVCVVMASGGYPGSYEKGFEITGLEEAEGEGAVVFHAGTSFKDGRIVNSGGRVLGVTARGGDIAAAIANAYAAVDKIHWQGCFCRRDIGFRALARQK